jgi:hypothetical protein
MRSEHLSAARDALEAPQAAVMPQLSTGEAVSSTSAALPSARLPLRDALTAAPDPMSALGDAPQRGNTRSRPSQFI